MSRSAICGSIATSARRSRICATRRSCGSPGGGSSRRYWSVFGATVLDLTDKRRRSAVARRRIPAGAATAGHCYEDECLELGLSWRRDYERIGDFRKGSTFSLSWPERAWPLSLRSAGLDKRQSVSMGCFSREFDERGSRLLNSSRRAPALRLPAALVLAAAGTAFAQEAAPPAAAAAANSTTALRLPENAAACSAPRMPSVVKATAIINGESSPRPTSTSGWRCWSSPTAGTSRPTRSTAFASRCFAT